MTGSGSSRTRVSLPTSPRNYTLIRRGSLWNPFFNWGWSGKNRNRYS